MVLQYTASKQAEITPIIMKKTFFWFAIETTSYEFTNLHLLDMRLSLIFTQLDKDMSFVLCISSLLSLLYDVMTNKLITRVFHCLIKKTVIIQK